MTRRFRFDWATFAGALFFAFFGLPSVAYAWGPCVHLWIGDTVVQTLAAAAPLTAAILRKHSRSFLYGCLSPDFYVGKGSTGHDEHCHNWATGRGVLDRAGTPSEQAFAYGYLCHLAADVIGHNHFVPTHLYRTFGLRKLGHAYWELNADNLVDRTYWDLAEVLVRGAQPENDRLLTETVSEPGGLSLPFAAKKRLFAGWIRFTNRKTPQLLLARARRHSETLLAKEDVEQHLKLSLALAIEVMKKPRASIAHSYDPIGACNIERSKGLRREMRRNRTFQKSDSPFPVPADLRALIVNVKPSPAPAARAPGTPVGVDAASAAF